MNYTNENTIYHFEVTYNNGSIVHPVTTLANIEEMASSTYYHLNADVASGIANIRLIGEADALNKSYWSGFSKAKEMAGVR